MSGNLGPGHADAQCACWMVSTEGGQFESSSMQHVLHLGSSSLSGVSDGVLQPPMHAALPCSNAMHRLYTCDRIPANDVERLALMLVWNQQQPMNHAVLLVSMPYLCPKVCGRQRTSWSCVSTAGVDPKSMVCEYFRAGQCTKGFKCKFSHDLDVERKTHRSTSSATSGSPCISAQKFAGGSCDSMSFLKR